PLFTLPQPQYWNVRLGDHHIKKKEDTEKTYNVSKVHYNAWYSKYDNDIAIMRLSEPVTVNENIRPICMPSKEDTFEGLDCVATGWGKVDFDKKGSSVLRKVNVKVFDNSVCHNAYHDKFDISIHRWHLCAGTLEGGKGTCHGDSGGPFQCKRGDKWYLAGLTSFGSGCAKRGFPDVYTRITYFLDWIALTKL
ncbi:transmembrane protease serine 3-like, partial [Limulus polyphemus]|uniref:Transmembrane protease serine 3-like n=1 Tax=Limulus polyphemus TaxID=6850 RepID=A0ABM1SUV7_LIMPO